MGGGGQISFEFSIFFKGFRPSTGPRVSDVRVDSGDLGVSENWGYLVLGVLIIGMPLFRVLQ